MYRHTCGRAHMCAGMHAGTHRCTAVPWACRARGWGGGLGHPALLIGSHLQLKPTLAYLGLEAVGLLRAGSMPSPAPWAGGWRDTLCPSEAMCMDTMLPHRDGHVLATSLAQPALWGGEGQGLGQGSGWGILSPPAILPRSLAHLAGTWALCSHPRRGTAH